MRAKFQVQPAQAEPFEVAIGNTATIGRTRENTICLSFSPQVSRQHAVVRCHNGFQYQLIDLGSRNGTYVNEQRVIMPALLQNGARVRIAENTLTFIEEAEEEGGEHLELTVGVTLENDALEARPVALLVCDIRGFSTMAEKTPSGDLAQTLGLWFRETGNLVTQTGGTVDKFIGDALLGYWGGAQNGAVDGGAALDAALKMLALADARTWPTGEPFRIAVALHYGGVTFSNIGLAAERDATIIGDAVNTVFRLEAVTKELGRRMVLSSDLVAHLAVDPASLEDFGDRALKGKQQTVRIYAWRG